MSVDSTCSLTFESKALKPNKRIFVGSKKYWVQTTEDWLGRGPELPRGTSPWPPPSPQKCVSTSRVAPWGAPFPQGEIFPVLNHGGCQLDRVLGAKLGKVLELTLGYTAFHLIPLTLQSSLPFNLCLIQSASTQGPSTFCWSGLPGCLWYRKG
jgi:hypothetical protein